MSIKFNSECGLNDYIYIYQSALVDFHEPMSIRCSSFNLNVAYIHLYNKVHKAIHFTLKKKKHRISQNETEGKLMRKSQTKYAQHIPIQRIVCACATVSCVSVCSLLPHKTTTSTHTVYTHKSRHFLPIRRYKLLISMPAYNTTGAWLLKIHRHTE